MGFNPLRRYRGGKTIDLIVLFAFPIVVIALLFWAMG